MNLIRRVAINIAELSPVLRCDLALAPRGKAFSRGGRGVLNHRINRELGELRSAAEARLQLLAATVTQQPIADGLCLQSEQQVQRVELELQTEQLQAAQVETQAELERYKDLFDFAPVGYLSPTEDGTINLVHLVGAQLLGLECRQLLELRMRLFISGAGRCAFRQFMYQVYAANTRPTFELGLLVQGSLTLTVPMTAVRSASAQDCRALLIDSTERKRAEQKVLEQLHELLRWQSVTLARAGRVQQLKAEAYELLAEQGLPTRYSSLMKS